jgi:hypothetical protein
MFLAARLMARGQAHDAHAHDRRIVESQTLSAQD